MKFEAALGLFLISREGLCEDCQRRRETNPLRVLDCKSVHCKEILKDAPVIRDYLCPDCAAHFARVLELLKRFGVNYEEQPKLVRGPGLLHPHRLRGGGRGPRGPGRRGRRRPLQRPVPGVGRPALPAIGFAIGEDRLLEVLPKELGEEPTSRFSWRRWASRPGIRPSTCCRNYGSAGWPPKWIWKGRSLKAQMTLADRYGAAYVVILGDRGLEQGEALVRPMKSFLISGRGEGPKLTELPSGRIVEDQGAGGP